MARPAQYNCNEVLWQATLLFWEKGYRAVSVADLVKATGLQPGSLYGRFGSKEGLFLECLEHYSAMADELRGAHADLASPLARLRSFYDAMVDDARSMDGQRGCLVVNASLECGPGEERVRAKVQDCMLQGEAWIQTQLDAAVAAGELRLETNTTVLAGCLSSSLYGYRVMARAQSGREKLRAVADASFDSQVGPWLAEPVLS